MPLRTGRSRSRATHTALFLKAPNKYYISVKKRLQYSQIASYRMIAIVAWMRRIYYDARGAGVADILRSIYTPKTSLLVCLKRRGNKNSMQDSYVRRIFMHLLCVKL